MLDPDALKRELIDSGRVTTERLAVAEAEARQQGIPLTAALVKGLMISFPDLGAVCARLTGLPYAPLVGPQAVIEDPSWMSGAFAAALGVVPVNYDPYAHAIAVAVADLEQGAELERLVHFLDDSVDLRLQVASDEELERALDRIRPRSGPLPDPRLNPRPEMPRRAPTPRGAYRRPAAPAPDAPPAAAKPPAPPAAGTPREPGYGEMSQALIAAATLLARQRYAEDPSRLHALTTQVRYARLMASRLKMPRVTTDGLVLAAWLTPWREPDSPVGTIGAPFRLDEVLRTERGMAAGRGREPRVEAMILGLLRSYQELKAENAGVALDSNRVRRELFQRWPTSRAHPNMLETFLQILVDEEFLDQRQAMAGRILIVDPREVSDCALSPPLVSMGYDVKALADTRSGREVLEDFRPDLIILDVEAAPDRALWFCERVKGDARTTAIPILALADPAHADMGVKCLRAGAEDVLTKPVFTELLLLKIQQRLSALGMEVQESGVSGSLEEMGFTDMIQILCAGGRSVDLLLHSGEEEGRIWIRDGDVVHAMLGEAAGEDAFYGMMRWKTGSFTTHPCGPAPERSIHTSAMSLLMEGARILDERPEPS